MSKHYHLIGIGGIGMSGIAQLLLSCGHKVSGSDLKDNSITNLLKTLGADIHIGHSSANISNAQTVVYSSAIKDDNPEIIEAKRLKIPLIMRAQALSELMSNKKVVTVAGSHGKTTTTSLVSYLLLEAGLMPTVAIGGILMNIDTNACFGSGSYFVAEADESDGSFLYYNPTYSIITNIDREHLDYYKTFDKEIDAFSQFLNRTDKDGCAFICDDDLNLKSILKDYKNKYILFGLKESADIFPKNIILKDLTSEFDCFFNKKFVDRFKLSLGGEHNISNALSVIAFGLTVGIDLKFIKHALANYKGTKRRLEVKFANQRVKIIDDYAHHPTEIQATLRAAKNLNSKRIIAIFQPHRYTRTQLLMDEFSRSFSNADYLIVTDIYPASEPAIEGVSAMALVDKIKKVNPRMQVCFLAKDKIIEHVLSILRPEDLVITLGAGDIVRLSDELSEKIKDQK